MQLTTYVSRLVAPRSSEQPRRSWEILLRSRASPWIPVQKICAVASSRGMAKCRWIITPSPILAPVALGGVQVQVSVEAQAFRKAAAPYCICAPSSYHSERCGLFVFGEVFEIVKEN